MKRFCAPSTARGALEICLGLKCFSHSSADFSFHFVNLENPPNRLVKAIIPLHMIAVGFAGATTTWLLGSGIVNQCGEQCEQLRCIVAALMLLSCAISFLRGRASPVLAIATLPSLDQ